MSKEHEKLQLGLSPDYFNNFALLQVPVDYKLRNAWLLRALPDEQNRNADQGLLYDDDLTYKYSYSKNVGNAIHIGVGDFLLLRDNNILLGSAIVQNIKRSIVQMMMPECPKCGSHGVQYKRRKRTGDWRCDGKCKESGNNRISLVPVFNEHAVETYTAEYGDTWSELTGALPEGGFQSLADADKWNRQNSIVKLNTAKVAAYLKSLDASKVHQVRVQENGVLEELTSGGFMERTVKTRSGQESFRAHLLNQYGANCAFTGSCHPAALEAAHLYQYAKVGRHYKDAGLLLRRDLHRLFDLGLISVSPDLKIQLDERLRFGQYEYLHGKRIKVPISKKTEKLLTEQNLLLAD